MSWYKGQGIYNIYKTVGPTSHDVIDKIRKITGVKRVGHAGTLDPLASGVLVVGIGREFTKKLSTVVAQNKEYQVVIKLGMSSTTDDGEGEKTKYKVKKIPNVDSVEKIFKQFTGVIKQTPPQYSAIKIKGKVAYKEARKGNSLSLRSREVRIDKIRLISYDWPLLELRVETGKGVYIRSLARDIGNQLGIGGFVYSLKRTRIGAFTSENSIIL